MSTLPRLSIFALFPPTPSGIADYCGELVPYWNRRFRALYVIDDDAPPPQGLPAETEVVRYREFTRRPEYDDATPRFYQIGNNRLHAFARRESERRPGVTMLHDFVLHHMLSDENRPADDPGSYATRLVAEHGAGARALLRLRERGWQFRNDPYRFPLNGYQLDHSLGVMVHSREAERQIRFARPALPVRRVPHHACPAPAGSTDELRAAARRRLQLDPNQFLLMALGHMTRPKQIELVVAALGQIRDRLPPFEFHLVGECHHAAMIRAAAYENRLSGRLVPSGFVTPEQLNDYILAADAVVNLRYPSGLETSGTLIRSMALGRPVIVFDYDSFSDFPAGTVVKLPLDTFRTDRLEEALLRLATDRNYRNAVGTAAAEYMQAEHAIEQCAAAHAEFIQQVYGLR